ARVQNFEIQFLKEAAKFVRDFKSLAKEADESLAKHKALELEIKRLLRAVEADASLAKHKTLEMDINRLLKAVVSQDIISIVQNASVVDTSDLQTELERTKERFENCIIKKETEYAKLWNDWYKKCNECKCDKISYDKAYKDMEQKIEWLQAQLGDLKARAEGNSNGINGNPIRCYNCQGEDHYASNCTVKPRKQDAAYLQKQMQIAQKEEARIQPTSEEFDFMAAIGACEENESDNANCTLKNNL
nr:hypothetical protein [Tanacetum cinerariifolium]